MRTATHKKLMVLLGKAKVGEKQRHELIHSWTRGRTRSTRELAAQELNDLCWKLEYDYLFRTGVDAYIELYKKKQRSVVLTIATRVGIHIPNDWGRFNQFMKASSIYKKELHKYEIEELDKLIRQMRALEANQNRSAETVGTKAWYRKLGFSEVSKN